MRILVAITGASGLVYGVRTAEVLKRLGHEVFVVVSEGARKVAKYENVKLPKSDFNENELDAPFASGSYKLDGMIVSPCSLKTLGEIANGVGSNLIARAGEVMLKERRRLVLVIRETPLSYVAIKNMETITLAGGIVLPASPGFYHSPKTIEDMVDFVVGKTLDQFGIQHRLFRRWKG
ncbi:MAG: UbiX family flavin prenyltransferase [Candidatus Anstonellales archaeon]